MRPAAGADRVGGWIGYFTRHPTAGNLVLAMMLLAGVWGATTLRAQFLPDVAIERIGVSVAWPGAGPEEVDRQIVAALEPVLLAVEGVVETRAVAREGLADIDLEFEPGWDMDRASGEVEAALDRVTTLPEAAERPRTRRMSWFDRVTDVVVHGPVSPEMLTRYALELQSRLFELGVTRTRIDGAPDPVIRVAVPEAMLARHDLTLAAVAEAARAAADAAPAGALSGGARLRAGEAARSAEAVGAIPVAPGAGGEPLRLREIAAVTVEGVEGGAASGTATRITGSGAPSIRVRVTPSSNRRDCSSRA
jgi:multidrug efflux pump subunit AcrB